MYIICFYFSANFYRVYTEYFPYTSMHTMQHSSMFQCNLNPFFSPFLQHSYYFHTTSLIPDMLWVFFCVCLLAWPTGRRSFNYINSSPANERPHSSWVNSITSCGCESRERNMLKSREERERDNLIAHTPRRLNRFQLFIKLQSMLGKNKEKELFCFCCDNFDTVQ